jgi:hypothetical protein
VSVRNHLESCESFAAVPVFRTWPHRLRLLQELRLLRQRHACPRRLVPAYTVNLMTAEGSAAFGAVWKTMKARVVEVDPMAARMPGYDKTYDIQPHAGEAGFDDSN